MINRQERYSLIVTLSVVRHCVERSSRASSGKEQSSWMNANELHFSFAVWSEPNAKQWEKVALSERKWKKNGKCWRSLCQMLVEIKCKLANHVKSFLYLNHKTWINEWTALEHFSLSLLLMSFNVESGATHQEFFCARLKCTRVKPLEVWNDNKQPSWTRKPIQQNFQELFMYRTNRTRLFRMPKVINRYTECYLVTTSINNLSRSRGSKHLTILSFISG